MNNKKPINLKLVLIAAGAATIIAVITAVVLMVFNPSKTTEDGSSQEETANVVKEELTEEEKQATEETVNKYTKIAIGKYEDVDGDPAKGKAVKVSVKNISEETVSLEIIIGAYGADDALLETSSLYAEMLEPGQTQDFLAFASTELAPEQLQSATFKIYQAKTYTVNAEGQTGEVVEEITEQTETPTQETPTE